MLSRRRQVPGLPARAPSSQGDVPVEVRETLASDDTQPSLAVLSSRLVSAVEASVSDGPVRPASTPRANQCPADQSI